MQYDFIGIRNQSINGIKNPCVTIVGTLTKKECEFLVLADGQKRDYSIDIVNRNGDFALFAPIDTSVKEVEVYIIVNNKKHLISKLKNSTSRRIKNKIVFKIKSIIRRLIVSIKFIFITIYKGIRLAWREHHFLIPPALWPKYLRAIKLKIIVLFGGLPYYNPLITEEYNKWINEKDIVTNEKEEFSYRPLISFVIPVYNIGKDFLEDCLESILAQTYDNFEICLADDCSTKKETIDTLKKYAKKDKRIKVVYRKENGNISEASNSAIEIAKGEFIALMDDDDVITSDALYQVVKVINNNKNVDMIYSDEDKMEMDGTLCEPHFKPDFSPDTLLGGNYICHFCVMRKETLDKVGYFRTEFNGAQDFDLFLRFTEKAKEIIHIPKVLYHWRKVPGSTAVTIENKDYAIENGRRAVEEALKRRKIKGVVTTPIKCTNYVVTYDIKDNPKVSIIIPTKDNYKLLEKCLKSIYKKTSYKNYEIIVVDNDSKMDKTELLLKDYKKKHSNFKVMEAKYAFNYSKINNEAVNMATGDYIVLLNNDTEVITPNWIEIMLGYAMQSHIGAVGAKLLYADDTVQHGGVILGINGVARHSHLGVEKDNLGLFGRLLIPFNYSAVTAACLMVKKSKYLEVDGLEEKLAVAYNDIDFNLKLLKRGYYNVFLPMVSLYHYESKSRGLDTTTKKYKLLQKETAFIKNKWQDELLNDRFYNPNYSLSECFMLDKKGKK